MAEGMNKVYLVGNLGADAELKRYESGSKLTFRIATTERWKDRETGEKKEHTEWHRCAMWGSRAEGLARHLTKGTTLLVEGRMETSSYVKEGVTKYSTEVRARDVRFLGSGNGRDVRTPSARAGAEASLA